MASLTRDQILAAIATRRSVVEPCEVPEWGGTLYIRLLSPAELKALGFFGGAVTGADLLVAVLAASIADEEGKVLFTRKDLSALAEADFPVANRVFSAAAKVNALDDRTAKEAEEDFGEAQDDGTSSA